MLCAFSAVTPICRNWSYELFCTSIRFGIRVISPIRPKSLRMRLRPVKGFVISDLCLSQHGASAVLANPIQWADRVCRPRILGLLPSSASEAPDRWSDLLFAPIEKAQFPIT
jgi:hypothetical protein